jgi:hypothetical protein
MVNFAPLILVLFCLLFADRFLQYEELTEWLHNQVSSNSDIATIESYGKSHEGRDLWLVTITNKSTGLHADKPAHWVDGKTV